MSDFPRARGRSGNPAGAAACDRRSGASRQAPATRWPRGVQAKRPIYWRITAPKGTLQALIYLHRYNRDTVIGFPGGYLRPYQQKLEAKRVNAEHVLTGGGSSQSEKTKAQKKIDEISNALEELSTWERDVVRPLAEKRIELDLDDGVKVNYGKLGAILAKVKGLNA